MNQPLPNWDMWVQMPALSPVEAVALSLNVDPKKVHKWSKDKWVFNTSPGLAQTIDEFTDRMFLFQKCFGFSGKISPPQLANWAKSVGWTIPEELESTKNSMQLVAEIPFVPTISPADANADASAVTDTLLPANDEGIKKREHQILVIEELGKILGYNMQQVPAGGKRMLMDLCRYARPDLFGASEHPFDGAWKKARQLERVRMVDHNDYVGR